MERKRIGLFGGTFNPIHRGHLHLARECQAAYHFDQMLFLPTNLPPHKAAADLASNEDRLAMVELALRNEPDFAASSIEYELGGKSYTVRTLEELQKRCPQAEFYLLIGADMFFTFRQWWKWERILCLANLIAGARQEDEYQRLCREWESYGEQQKRISILRCTPEEMSSTQIREELKRGGDVSQWLDSAVEAYIKEHGLYGCGRKA